MGLIPKHNLIILSRGHVKAVPPAAVHLVMQMRTPAQLSSPQEVRIVDIVKYIQSLKPPEDPTMYSIFSDHLFNTL